MDDGNSDAASRVGVHAPRTLLLRALAARLRLAALLVLAVVASASWRTVADRVERWFPVPAVVAVAGDDEYFCPMHPHVVRSSADRCPTCSMPLSRRSRDSGVAAGDALRLSLSAAQVHQAGVRTAVVAWRPLVRDLRVSGTLRFDEGGVRRIGTGFSGLVTSVEASVEGALVPRGAPLLRLASTSLSAALDAHRASRRQLAEVEARAATAAIERLRTQTEALRRQLLEAGISAEQLDADAPEAAATADVALRAPFDCVVLHVEVAAGEPVLAGSPLIHIADPTRLVAVLDVPRSEAALIEPGLAAELLDPAAPERRSSGTVAAIAPFVDEDTQSVAVRVAAAADPAGPRPGSRIAARVRVPLAGAAPWRSLPRPPQGPPRTVYVCPMHDLVQDLPGICTDCGAMELLPREVPGGPAEGDVLAVPDTAVVDTGTRQIVFVELDAGTFEARTVVVGPRTSGWCPVVSGLHPGTRVVAAGAFLLDAASRLEPAAAGTYFGASAGPPSESPR